ncbi:hypothetical protein ACOME3_001146 [Neoechinorhynchus agilis]
MQTSKGDISSYFVVKHSWKGKYKRVFVLNRLEIRTLNPSNLEITNQWQLDSVLELVPNPRVPTEFTFVFRKQRSNAANSDTMRFSCDFRSDLITDANRLIGKLVGDNPISFEAYKMTWNGTERKVQLKITTWAVEVYSCDINRLLLSSYLFSNIDRLDLSSQDNLVRLVLRPFERSHTFRLSFNDNTNAFANALSQVMNRELAIQLNIIRTSDLGHFDLRFGPLYGRSEAQASLSEFSVYKQQTKQRLLCLSTTCMVERDPRTYSISSLIPYSHIHSLHRCPTDMRRFEIVTSSTNDDEIHKKRSYASSDRDNLLVALLDSIRASGNINAYVHSHVYERSMHWAPLDRSNGPDVEEIHVRLLLASHNFVSADDFAEDQLRFVCNINHGGPLIGHSNGSSLNYFSENRNRLITSALVALVNNDEREETPVQLELKFLAMRRLLCCQAGFECFSAMQQFRESMGRSVSRAIKCNDSAAAYAAVEALNVLMQQPITSYEESSIDTNMESNNATANDLLREQSNKKYILHSTRFLASLLNRLWECVKSGTSSLVVCSLLDFFTFALCAPFSETTDGAQFEQILALTASPRNSASNLFYQLVDHPSLTVRKGAALILRALIEESKGEARSRLIGLALTEGSILSHLSTALYGPAAVTSTAGGDRTFVRKLSRSLLDLWTTDGVIGETYVLLKRIFPAGLLRALTSNERVNNPKDFVEDCCCLENSSSTDATAQQMKRDNVSVLGRQNESAALKSLLFIEKHVNRALNHWKLRINLKSDNASWSSGSGLIVLRRKRPRPADACTLNWQITHAIKPDLIWDFKTRRELRDRLAAEYNGFVQARSLCPPGIEIAWNCDEFFITYVCLQDEVKIGSYYLRLLIDKSSDLLTNDFIEPFQFFHQLYHKFLLSEPKSSMRRMCARALGIVYTSCFEHIGWFSDVAFIVNLIDKGANADRIERDHLIDFCFALTLHKQSASDFICNRGLNVLINLMPLCHLHTNRATFAAPILQSAMIEAAPCTEGISDYAEWYVQDKGIRSGPFSGQKIVEMLKENCSLSPDSQVWAPGMEAWRPIERVSQFYWMALVDESVHFKTETDLAITILSALIRICKYFPSRKNGAVVRPLPRVMTILSEPIPLTTLSQLALTFDPIIVEKVAVLLSLIIRDNPCVSRLYATGIFFFFLMYQGSNLRPIATFLHATHLRQAFRLPDASGELTSRSILAPLLPDAMIYYLENYGPEKFSEAFLSECRTPEIIWDASLRRHLISKIALHLYDYSPRLKSNIYAPYQYCPLPRIEYPPPLKDELFCHQFYLKELCRNPEWPISDPVQLLKDCLKRWKEELAMQGSTLSTNEACKILELDEEGEVSNDLSHIRRAYFRLAQKYHPDKNPAGRDKFEQVNKAYDFLVQYKDGNGSIIGGPNKRFIILLMEAQSYVYGRFSRIMQPFCYAGYGPLIETIERFKEDEGNLMDINDGDTDSVIPAALDLCVATVSCSALNAESFRSTERGISLLKECYTKAVNMLGTNPNETDTNVLTCVNVARFWTVAGRFQRCRNDIPNGDDQDILTLPNELCHTLRLAIDSHITVLATHTLEACDALSGPVEISQKRIPDQVNQLLIHEFVRSGLPLQLLRTFFNYDSTMDASQPHDDEDPTIGVVSGKQRALNRLAILAGNVLGRFLRWVSGCLPEHMARMTSSGNEDRIIEFLRLFHSNTYGPMLLWDNSCRRELANLLDQSKGPFEVFKTNTDEEQAVAFNILSNDFHYSLHENEPSLVGVYLKHYIEQPDEATDSVDQELFVNLLPTTDESDISVDIRLKALLVLCGRYEPDASCLSDHMSQLVKYLKEDSRLTAQSLLALCSYESCVNIMTQAPVGSALDTTSLLCSALLNTLVDTNEPNVHLSVLTVLSARPYFVKQFFEQRGHIAVVSVFISEVEDHQHQSNECHKIRCFELSERKLAAQLLSRVCSDTLSGRRVRLQLDLFLPSLILDKLSDPEVACALYMNDYNNPELVWNRLTRQKVKEAVHRFIADGRDSPLPDQPVYFESAENEDEYQVSGVYLNAFLATPGWVVRNPKKFSTELLERWIRTINTINALPKESPPTQHHQLLQLLTDCLLSLFGTGQDLSVTPATQQVYALLMDSTVPSTGAIPFICSSLVNNDDAVGACALKLISCLAESEICFRQMTDINAAVGGQSPLAPSLLNQIDRRADLLPVVSSLLATIMHPSREFSMNHEKLLW